MSSEKREPKGGPEQTPEPWTPPAWVVDGEVGDPMTEEEAVATLLAWWAECPEPASDEEAAEARRLADLAERNEREIAEVRRRWRASQERAQEGHQA